VRLDHQVITDDDRVIPIALGGKAPHLNPGVVRGLVGPDLVEGVIGQMDGGFVATRSGTEMDDDVNTYLFCPADQVVQIGQRGGIQLVGRFLGEEAGIGRIDQVGAQIPKVLNILASCQLDTFIRGKDPARVQISTTQVGAIQP
jgi:hypothetical protein